MSDDLIAGRYRLGPRLGAGGMSEVWLADDLELERRVALKLLAPQADRERFRREARAVAALSDPNINLLYDYGDADGRPFMVLEYLAGGTLQNRLAPEQPLPDTETEQIARDVASGLAHAHEHRLVHRDLKPANVLFDGEGRAKIADFGIARMGGAGTLTEAGTVLGTATTISPEQAAGRPATAASDVYSFGVILFWMLTGRPPFAAERPLDLVAMHRDSEPPAVSSLRPDAPAALAGLASACLAKDARARPADGGDVLRELGTVPAATTAVMRPPHQRRRLPIAVPLALGAFVLASAGAGVAYVAVHGGSSGAGAATTISSVRLPSVSSGRSTAAGTAPASSATRATTTTAAPPTTRGTTTRRTTTHATTSAPAVSTIATLPDTTTLPPPSTDTSTVPPATAAPTVGSTP
jgi:serine/threonine protein kinase